MNGASWERLEELLTSWTDLPPSNTPRDGWTNACTDAAAAFGRWRTRADVPPPSLLERTDSGIVCEWWIKKRGWRLAFQSAGNFSIVGMDAGRILLALCADLSTLHEVEGRFLEPMVRAAALGVSNAPGAGPDAGDAPCTDGD